MKISHLIFVTLLTLFSHTHAKDAAIRTCRIVFPDRPVGAPKTLHLFDGTTSQQVELASMNLSPLYELAIGDIEINLLTAKVEDPKAVFPDAPSVEIPAEYTDFILLVSSDPNNKITPIKLQAINLEIENFKLGQTLWINHSDKNIEGKLGEQILSLGPKISKILDSPISDKGIPTSGYFSASFTYQAQGKDTFEPITEQQWWHDAKCRHLGFINNSERKLPKIYFFRDFRDP